MAITAALPCGTGIRKEYAKHPKVLRIELGLNPGETDLVLREF